MMYILYACGFCFALAREFSQSEEEKSSVRDKID